MKVIVTEMKHYHLEEYLNKIRPYLNIVNKLHRK